MEHLGRAESKNSNASDKRKHVLVIGGGVSGLTSAWKLLEAGFRVTVIAKEYAPTNPRIVSQIAGALWEWPPAVCGKHKDPVSLARSKDWCMVSYRQFAQMAANPQLSEATGVRMRLANFFFDKPIRQIPDVFKKVQELELSSVDGFRHDPNIIEEELGSGTHPELKDAYQHMAPVIDTDTYMIWLSNYVKNLGANLLRGEIQESLLILEKHLLKKFKADAIVNCTGLGAIVTAGDDCVFPMRGALLRVRNDGSRFPKITSAICVSHDDSKDNDDEDLVFIVPRSENVLLLGGSVEPHEWDLDLTLQNSAVVRRMRDRCIKFLPSLANAQLIEDYPVAVGLRPFRRGSVRVEADPGVSHGNPNSRSGGTEAPTSYGSRIVHNYGHGGSGFTLSHGCAQEVVEIVIDMLESSPRTPEKVVSKIFRNVVEKFPYDSGSGLATGLANILKKGGFEGFSVPWRARDSCLRVTRMIRRRFSC